MAIALALIRILLLQKDNLIKQPVVRHYRSTVAPTG
jgi:hypothetical protein